MSDKNIEDIGGMPIKDMDIDYSPDSDYIKERNKRLNLEFIPSPKEFDELQEDNIDTTSHYSNEPEKPFGWKHDKNWGELSRFGKTIEVIQFVAGIVFIVALWKAFTFGIAVLWAHKLAIGVGLLGIALLSRIKEILGIAAFGILIGAMIFNPTMIPAVLLAGAAIATLMFLAGQ